MSRLARMDQQNGFSFNLEHGWQRNPRQQERDAYEGMKLAELKQLCKQRKLPTWGTKALLRRRLEDNGNDAI